MIKDVIDYCRKYEVCHKTSPLRTVIMYRLKRSSSVELIFSHFYVATLGPLFNHKVEYYYCIVFLDHTCRYPHDIALCNLSAIRVAVKRCYRYGSSQVFQSK